MSYLSRELGIVGDSQNGKTWLANKFLSAMMEDFSYEKRPLVIGAYRKVDYSGVSYSNALLRNGESWSSDLKKRVENRIVVVEDLSLVKNREAHSRLEDMFKRRRFDIVTIAQDFAGLKHVIGNIRLFALFGLKEQKFIAEAVRSKTANVLQERVRVLKPREYVIVDNQTKHVSVTYDNDNVSPLVEAFKMGVNEMGELYASENPVRKKANSSETIVSQVLSLKNEGFTNAVIAKKLGKTQASVGTVVFRLRERGVLK